MPFTKYFNSASRVAILILALSAFSHFAIAQIKMGGTPIDINYVEPKEYEIGGIEVRGVKFLDPNNVISLTGLKVGDVITVPGEKISSAIRKLWEFGILGDIDISASRTEGKFIFLIFNLKERPRLSRFTFKGTKKAESDDLRDKIKLTSGRVVTDALIKNTQLAIKKFYMDKGFLNAKVNLVQIEDSAIYNGVVLRIEVNKGRKVKIDQIDIDGNEFYTDEQIRRKMKDTKEKRWYRIFKASKYVKTKFEEDKEKIISFYNKNGYRDAEIEMDTLVRLSDNRIRLSMKINEGKKYYFRHVRWTGNYLYTSAQLSEVLGIKAGDIYNQETLQKKLTYNPNGADISSLYMDDGYLFFNVDPVEVSIENDSIDIEMRISEGSQATIDKVTVSGNHKTSDKVVLREIRTLPGEKFSRSDLIRTQRELSQLGYFNPETIGINPVPNPEKGTVDIHYTVEEKPSDQVELSGGWGGYYGFVGTAGLSFNNFSLRKVPHLREWQPLPGGDGQRLSLRAQANGPQFQSYTLSFTEPWLGGRKPTSLTVSLNNSQQRYITSVTSGAPAQRLSMTGMTVAIGKRVRWPDDFFTLMFSANTNLYTLENYAFPELPQNADGTYPNLNATNLNFTTTISRNSINNPTFPSNGSSISLQVSLTPPYSLFRDLDLYKGSIQNRYKYIEYHKWMFDAAYYLPVAKNLVLATRTHFGFLGAYNNNIGIGPFERFRVGGAGLSGFNFLLGYDIIGLRGYQDTRVYNERTTASYSAGVAYNKYVTELRYAISTNPSATIFVLAFFEAGNNFLSYEKYNPFNVYRSVGVGARIFMPQFGLIGIDFGKALNDIPGLDGGGHQTFTFTIGQQLR